MVKGSPRSMARQPSIRPPTRIGNSKWLAMLPRMGIKASIRFRTKPTTTMRIHGPTAGVKSRQPSLHQAAPRAASTGRGSTMGATVSGCRVGDGGSSAMVFSLVTPKSGTAETLAQAAVLDRFSGKRCAHEGADRRCLKIAVSQRKAKKRLIFCRPAPIISTRCT